MELSEITDFESLTVKAERVLIITKDTPKIRMSSGILSEGIYYSSCYPSLSIRKKSVMI